MLSEFQGFVRLLSPDMPVIQQNQGEHRPGKPYAAWRVISEVSNGLPFKFDGPTTDPAKYVGERVERQLETRIEVNFYSDTRAKGSKDARDYCNEFLAAVYLTKALDYAANKGFSILDISNYQNLDEHLGDKWERRAACEVTVLYTVAALDEIPFIEAQPGDEISGTFYNQLGEEI